MTMPQRKDTNLYLWDYDNLSEPIFTFSGHTDVPTEFVWRVGHIDDETTEYQLVTWSKDQNLRLWPLEMTGIKDGLQKTLEEEAPFDPILQSLREEVSSHGSDSGSQSRILIDTEIIQRMRDTEGSLKSITEASESKELRSYYEWEPNMSPGRHAFEEHTIQKRIKDVEIKFPTLTFRKVGTSVLQYA